MAATTAHTAFLRRNLDEVLLQLAPKLADKSPSTMALVDIMALLRREFMTLWSESRASLMDERADYLQRELHASSTATSSTSECVGGHVQQRGGSTTALYASLRGDHRRSFAEESRPLGKSPVAGTRQACAIWWR